MPTAEIRLSDLTKDARLQTRGGIDPQSFKRLKEAAEDGQDFDPIQVVVVGDKKYLCDGYTRTSVLEQLGRDTVPANWKEGAWRDAVLEAAKANSKHGQPRNPGDTRRAMELLVAEIPESVDWSSRKFADAAGAPKSSAHRFLAELKAKARPPEITHAEPEVPHGAPEEAEAREVKTRPLTPKQAEFFDSLPDDPGALCGPSPDEEPEDPIQARIEECRIYDLLPEECRDKFEADARLYYETEALLEPLRAFARKRDSLKGRRRPDGVFAAALHRVLHHPGPTEWKLCATCAGIGCDQCYQLGYIWSRRS